MDQRSLPCQDFLFSAGIVINNKIYLFTEKENIFMTIDMKNWEMKYLDRFTGYNLYCGRTDKLLIVNNKLYKLALDGKYIEEFFLKRRLKEIAMGQLVLCTLGCWLSMATFGNFAIKLQMSGTVNISAYLDKGDEAGAILAVLYQLPFSKVFMCVLLVISFVFLATTMDSSAFAAAEMTVRQNSEESLAPGWLRIVWAVVASMIAFVLLQVGGTKAVRSLCYIMGMPLSVITFFVFASIYKMLKEDCGEV